MALSLGALLSLPASPLRAEDATPKSDSEEKSAPEEPGGSKSQPVPPPAEESQAGAGGPGVAPEVCLALTPEEKLALGAFDPRNPIYPVTYRQSQRPTTAGEQVLVVRIMECEPESNFAVVSVGTVLKATKDGSKLALKLSRNIAVANYYNQSGAAWDFVKVAASLDETDTWCIPRKEFCTKDVGFNDFGLKGKPGDQFTIEWDKVFSLSNGPFMALQAIITEHCGKRPAPQELCIAYGPDKKFCKPLTMESARALYPELAAEPADPCAPAKPAGGAQ